MPPAPPNRLGVPLCVAVVDPVLGWSLLRLPNIFEVGFVPKSEGGAPPTDAPMEGGGPAGVVELLPNENRPVLFAAGVVVPAAAPPVDDG